LGRNVDLLNIEWIYRGIKFYNLIPEELINFVLSNGYEFEYKDLKKMCYSNIEELKKIVLKTQYDFLFDTEKDVDLYMERRMQRYLQYKFLDAFKKAKLDIHLSMAYFHLLEYEIRDIISILEAKKYGLTMEETKDYLVMKVEGSDE
jgi:V/A-type H+-transporting ATPase subunit C